MLFINQFHMFKIQLLFLYIPNLNMFHNLFMFNPLLQDQLSQDRLLKWNLIIEEKEMIMIEEDKMKKIV